MKFILLADDDDDDRTLFEMAFSLINPNLTLETVSSGQQVLNYLEITPKKLPALIVLDYNMPKMNGADVIKAVYKHPHNQSIPIVILSTCSTDNVVAKCLNEGAIKYFKKPTGINQLVSITEEILLLIDES